MEGELLSADEVIDTVSFWCREVENHPPLAILFGYHSQPRGPEAFRRPEGEWAQNSSSLHLYVQFCLNTSGCASAEAKLRAW